MLIAMMIAYGAGDARVILLSTDCENLPVKLIELDFVRNNLRLVLNIGHLVLRKHVLGNMWLLKIEIYRSCID